MARNRKRPQPATPAAPRPDLSDWQGFRARRHSPRFRLLVGAALFAAITTLVASQYRHLLPQAFFDLWIFSLLALQVLVVVEGDLPLRGWMRRAAPVACAFAVSAFVALALGASPLATFGLAAAMLAVGFMPPSWHDWLLENVAP
jgi:hypothetical protein